MLGRFSDIFPYRQRMGDASTAKKAPPKVSINSYLQQVPYKLDPSLCNGSLFLYTTFIVSPHTITILRGGHVVCTRGTTCSVQKSSHDIPRTGAYSVEQIGTFSFFLFFPFFFFFFFFFFTKMIRNCL